MCRACTIYTRGAPFLCVVQDLHRDCLILLPTSLVFTCRFSWPEVVWSDFLALHIISDEFTLLDLTLESVPHIILDRIFIDRPFYRIKRDYNLSIYNTAREGSCSRQNILNLVLQITIRLALSAYTINQSDTMALQIIHYNNMTVQNSRCFSYLHIVILAKVQSLEGFIYIDMNAKRETWKLRVTEQSTHSN